MTLENAVVFVTGANRGLGRRFVTAALARGARKVYAAARDPSTLAALRAESGGRVIAVPLDVTDAAACTRAASHCPDVTLLVNNAGALGNYGGYVTRPDNAAIRREMDVNYYGVINLCQAFAPVLGHNGGGGIINVLSILAEVATPVVGSYCASKFATLALTRCVAAELAAQGTRVLAALPATIDTDMAAGYPGPKDAPEFVVATAYDALLRGDAEVHIGELSNEVATAWRRDQAAVTRERATMLP